MTASNIQVTAGSGTRLATNSYTEGAVTVHDEKMILGEQYLASYAVNNSAQLLTTANDHQLQLMAGSSLNLYIRRILVYQIALATTAAIGEFRIFRLTTAGTGGTSTTPQPLDNAFGASGATAQSLPTAKGTEGTRMWIGSAPLTQTVTATPSRESLLFDLEFDGLRLPSLKVPSGTTNGIAFKNVTAVAAASIVVNIWFTEASF